MADTHNAETSNTEANQIAGGNIVLTGFMGTGKTTVGRLLAEHLGFEVIDTDALIENRFGPIPQIFQQHGEPRFREIEREVATELGQMSGLVIATGGRMMLDPTNIQSLTRNGRVFCLAATPDEIMQRVTADHGAVERPLLAVPDPRQRIVELLAERTPEYRRFAQLTTDGRTPEAIADELATLVRTGPRRFAVKNPSGDYHYVVGTAILPLVRRLASIDGPMVVVTEPRAASLYVPIIPDPDLVIQLPAAEVGGKTLDRSLSVVERIKHQLIEAGMDHSATMVSLGDGVVADVAAFVAATYDSDLDLVHCPTDLTAMIDINIDGRAAPDPGEGRDLGGKSKPPKMIVADVATLQTLSPRRFAAGMAEVVKQGLIADSALPASVEGGARHNDKHSLAGRLGDLQALVTQAAQVKIARVKGNRFD